MTYIICTECEIHHYENCGTCFGFGFHSDGTIISAADACNRNYGGWRHCYECGSSPFGVKEGTMTQDIHFTASGKQIEDALNGAVRASLSGIFHGPSQYGKPAGPGYAVVEERILEWAKTANLDEYIEAEATKAIEAILPKAIESAIRNRAGVILSSLIRSGALDDQIASVIETKWTERKRHDSGY